MNRFFHWVIIIALMGLGLFSVVGLIDIILN